MLDCTLGALWLLRVLAPLVLVVVLGVLVSALSCRAGAASHGALIVVRIVFCGARGSGMSRSGSGVSGSRATLGERTCEDLALTFGCLVVAGFGLVASVVGLVSSLSLVLILHYYYYYMYY